MSTLSYKDQVGITHNLDLQSSSYLATNFSSTYNPAKSLWVYNGSQVVGLRTSQNVLPSTPSIKYTYSDNHRYGIKINNGTSNLFIKNSTIKNYHVMSIQLSGKDNYRRFSWSRTWKAEDVVSSVHDCNFICYATPILGNNPAYFRILLDGVQIYNNYPYSAAAFCAFLGGYHTVTLDVTVAYSEETYDIWQFDAYSTEP